MDLTARRLAARTLDRVREEYRTFAFLLRHPRQVGLLPRWLRERNATTVKLRSPWWPYRAIDWVATALPERARVFEYGGGGSTLWLEDRGATVTVAEHDEEWHKHLARLRGVSTRLMFRPASTSGVVTSEAVPGYLDSYVTAIREVPDGSLDLVIIDGRARVECARHAMPKVKPGGLLLFDDTDRARYQPAIQMLSAWERHDFPGLKPGQRFPAQTSIWRRPA